MYETIVQADQYRLIALPCILPLYRQGKRRHWGLYKYVRKGIKEQFIRAFWMENVRVIRLSAYPSDGGVLLVREIIYLRRTDRMIPSQSLIPQAYEKDDTACGDE